MRAEQLGLEPEHCRVARRQVRDRLEPGRALDRCREHQRAHSRAGGCVVVDVHEGGAAGLECGGDLQHPAVIAAERRIELHGRHPLALTEHARQARVLGLLDDREHHLPLLDHERGGRRAVFFDGRGDGADLGWSRAAAAADDLRAEIARVRREVGEVVRRRVREHHAAPGQARKAHVRHRRQGQLAVGVVHLVQRGQRRVDARPVIRADRGQARFRERLDRLSGRDAAERLALLVEGQHRHYGQ